MPEYLLRHTPPFSHLTDVELRAVAAAAQRRTVERHTDILVAGRPSEGLYVVLSGTVQLLFCDDEGHEFIAALLGPNALFGETALLGAEPCPASARAASPCEVVFVPKDVIDGCLATNPAAAAQMARLAVEKLCATQRRLAHLALTTVYERVAAAMLEHRENICGSWVVTVGVEQMARMVGSSREMVTRVVRRMMSRQLVRREHRRRLVLLEPEALRRETVKDRSDAAEESTPDEARTQGREAREAEALLAAQA